LLNLATNHTQSRYLQAQKRTILKNRLNLVLNFLLILFLIILNSCGSKKSASELNNEKYSKILNRENKVVQTLGSYVSIDTLPSLDKQFKDEISISILKFNKNKTVQLSKESKLKITNKNLTDYLNDYTSYYYYLKTNSTLILERYEGKHIKTPFYAWGGPPTKPYKVAIRFKIKGDTLIRIGFKKKYILNSELIDNHKEVKKGI
jgi:hypothetical protein